MVDYLEMLPREIRHMWDSQRLTVPKALFFALRYYVFIHAGVSGYCTLSLGLRKRDTHNSKLYYKKTTQASCIPEEAATQRLMETAVCQQQLDRLEL